ncbi:TPA: STY4528 family pathogenicity island replication protein [Salmonella enterica subsp. diarizonae serovar 61:r:-]
MTPYIQALINTTGNKLQQRMQKDPSSASDSLLFMGNAHDTVPRRLLQDPLLSPRDKFAWQVIRTQAQENGGAVFPSYSELQVQLSNRPLDEKASRSTVSRALLMLRLTRWLSLCHKARDRVSGRILGNIYALHDEPLTVLDAVRFDASYLHLLEQCSRHENKTIRATAQGILYNIRQDTSLRYLSSRIDLLEERARWQQRQSSEETKPETGAWRLSLKSGPSFCTYCIYRYL